MLLNELAKTRIPEPVKQTVFDYFRLRSKTWKNPDERQVDDNFEEKLLTLGWKRLGAGSFSSVFQNPKKNYVLKINKRHDEGYEHFVRLIHRYPNKSFPRISDMKNLDIDGENYYVYLIEKLSKIPERTAEKYAYIFAHVIDNPTDSLAQLFNSENWSYLPHSTPQIFRRNPALITALRVIGRNIGYFGNDIHLHNIMYRKDGTIVIIDPYS